VLSYRSLFDLSPNAIARALAKAREAGRPILDLTESNPTHAGLPYAGQVILQAMVQPPALSYEPSPFGLPLAREAVAKQMAAGGVAIDPGRVVLTASTSEAYAFLFKLLCDPGDEVLVPRPSYPLFDHLAQLEAVRSIPYRLAYDGAWHIDLPSLRSALSARTRAIIVVNPNNPTGSYVKREELEVLGSLGLPIVSDEVFASYPLRDDPSRVGSALKAEGAPLVFALGGLSKLSALPQMKVAWMAVGGTNAQVQQALGRLEVIADAFLSVATPMQRALPGFLASRGVVRKALDERLRNNCRVLREMAVGSSASLLDVEGGWYATLRLPRTRSEQEWVLRFLEEDGVYVHPGHFFDFEGEAYVIVSLLAPEAILAEGVGRIISRVDAEG
jgi:aspartate/methionine/tyrosine aminotransferase